VRRSAISAGVAVTRVGETRTVGEERGVGVRDTVGEGGEGRAASVPSTAVCTAAENSACRVASAIRVACRSIVGVSVGASVGTRVYVALGVSVGARVSVGMSVYVG